MEEIERGQQEKQNCLDLLFEKSKEIYEENHTKQKPQPQQISQANKSSILNDLSTLSTEASIEQSIDQVSERIESALSLAEQEHCSLTLTSLLSESKSSLVDLKKQISNEINVFHLKLHARVQDLKMRFSIKKSQLNSQIDQLNMARESLKLKEEDLNQEVQTLLSSIDEHKKVNARLNKHFKKRLRLIEKDLTHLSNLLIDSSGGLVAYNGITLGPQKKTKGILGTTNKFAVPPLTQRNFLNEKTQSVVNSARQNSFRNPNNTQTINNPQSILCQAQTFLQQVQDKLRTYIDTKVRLKDPLDDNGAHLIPESSRGATGRTFMGQQFISMGNQYIHGTIQSGQCSTRYGAGGLSFANPLDRGFIQNSSRSNLIGSHRGCAFQSKGMTCQNTGQKMGGGFGTLCDTCLTHEQYSVCSGTNEEQKVIQDQQVEDGLVKEYLGGKNPNELSLSQREKVLNSIHQKQSDKKQIIAEPRHVKIEEILNCPYSKSLIEKQQQNSNKPTKLQPEQIDDSFTLQQIGVRQKKVKVPSLNLEKIKNLNDYQPFPPANNSVMEHKREGSNLLQDHSQKARKESDITLNLNISAIEPEKVDDAHLYRQTRTNQGFISFGESLNALSPIDDQMTDHSKIIQDHEIFEYRQPSQLSQINQSKQGCGDSTIKLDSICEVPELEDLKSQPTSVKQPPSSKFDKIGNSNYATPKNQVLQKSEQDSSTHQLIRNLDELFRCNQQKCDENSVNQSRSNSKSSDARKIVIKKQDIQFKLLRKSGNDSAPSSSQQQQAQPKTNGVIINPQRLLFNKNQNETPVTFTLGSQAQKASSFLSSAQQTQSNLQEILNKANNISSEQSPQPVIIRQQIKKIGDIRINYNTANQQQVRQPSNPKARPIIAKQINNVFNINSQSAANTGVNSESVSYRSQKPNSRTIQQQQRVATINTHDISEDLIQLNEYLSHHQQQRTIQHQDEKKSRQQSLVDNISLISLHEEEKLPQLQKSRNESIQQIQNQESQKKIRISFSQQPQNNQINQQDKQESHLNKAFKKVIAQNLIRNPSNKDQQPQRISLKQINQTEAPYQSNPHGSMNQRYFMRRITTKSQNNNDLSSNKPTQLKVVNVTNIIHLNTSSNQNSAHGSAQKKQNNSLMNTLNQTLQKTAQLNEVEQPLQSSRTPGDSQNQAIINRARLKMYMRNSKNSLGGDSARSNPSSFRSFNNEQSTQHQ